MSAAQTIRHTETPQLVDASISPEKSNFALSAPLFTEQFSARFVAWFAEFQFRNAWLWRKHLEPGGSSHPDTKDFNAQPISTQIFRLKMGEGILHYLHTYGVETIQNLRAIGIKMLQTGVALDQGELVEPLKGVPLKDGTIALLDQNLLNELAFAHHSTWMYVRDWTLTLPDKSLHQPPRKEHQAWDRNQPNKSWDRDRGNIYGLAFALACMPEEQYLILIQNPK